MGTKRNQVAVVVAVAVAVAAAAAVVVVVVVMPNVLFRRFLSEHDIEQCSNVQIFKTFILTTFSHCRL